MKKPVVALALIAAFASFAPAHAQQHPPGHEGHGGAASPSATSLTEGEVRKVDKESKKLTIRHGAIANLDMPPMTMVFQVQDPAVLDSVKAGDKIRFQAEKSAGAYTVTKIEPAM